MQITQRTQIMSEKPGLSTSFKEFNNQDNGKNAEQIDK